MIAIARLFALLCLVLAGCSTAKKVAVSSFRVVDAPARYVRDHIDPPVTTATTTETSDVEKPGHPIATPTPVASSRRTTTTTTDAPTGAGARSNPPAATPKNASAPSSFPTARTVPGRPGYVYSLDPNGGIVDVTGYKSGDKAKDPYTKQVFIIP